MYKIITFILIALSLFNIQAFAFDSNGFTQIVNDLQGLCSLTNEDKNNYIRSFENIVNKPNYKNNLENLARSLQDKCINNEINNHLQQEESKEQFERIKLFLEKIKPLQNEYGESKQYNYVSVGEPAIGFLTWLTRLFNPDNWLTLPDIVGKWNKNQSFDESIKQVFTVSGINDVNNNGQVLFNFSLFIDVIKYFIFAFLFLSIIFYGIKGLLFNNLKVFTSDMASLLNKIIAVFIFPTFISLLILLANFSSFLVITSLSTTTQCSNDSGLECVATSTFQTVKKMDLIKLPSSQLKFSGDKTDILKMAQSSSPQDIIVDIFFSLISFITFCLIGGIFVFFGFSFVSNQITLLIKYFIWLIGSYVSLFNPQSSIFKTLKSALPLLITQIVNSTMYILTIGICLFIARDGISLQDIILISVFLTASSVFTSHYYGLLQFTREDVGNKVNSFMAGSKMAKDWAGKQYNNFIIKKKPEVVTETVKKVSNTKPVTSKVKNLIKMKK